MSVSAILAALPLFRKAVDVIGSFVGDEKAAKASAVVQDAASIIGAVAPLVQQFASGTPVTPEQVRQALAGKDAALAELDEEIARRSEQDIDPDDPDA